MKKHFTLFLCTTYKKNPIIEPYYNNRIKSILEKALDELNLIITTKIRKGTFA